MQTDNFTNIALNNNNLDKYFIRTSIYNAIKSSLINFKGNLLDIGCGAMPYKNYLLQNSTITNYTGLDIETALEYDAVIRPDFTWNGITMPFENDHFETAFGTEVLEHCHKPEIILNEVNRVLKPGGVFFFTVPFLWPLHEVPNDEYRYTPFSLNRILKESGFENIDIRATGGWHASMAQMIGLWARRSPLGNNKRKILSYLLKPLVSYLIRKDKQYKIDFNEGQMIAGLYGLAYKKK